MSAAIAELDDDLGVAAVPADIVAEIRKEPGSLRNESCFQCRGALTQPRH